MKTKHECEATVFYGRGKEYFPDTWVMTLAEGDFPRYLMREEAEELFGPALCARIKRRKTPLKIKVIVEG